jgi:DNA-binding MarR family transcriptional regulator
MERTDFLAAQRTRAFGTRLRRLCEALNQGVSATYREAGVAFEPRWFGLMALLRARSSIEIGEAAAALGQSHVAIVQVANALASRKLVRRTISRADKRRRTIAITPKGEALCVRLDPLWNAVQKATDDLLRETVPQFLQHLDAIDAALVEMPLEERIRRFTANSNEEACHDTSPHLGSSDRIHPQFD